MKRMKLLFIALTAAAFVFGCSKAEETVAPGVKEEELQEEFGMEVPSYLTGKMVSPAIGRQRPIAVMFNNIKAGCPQTGISRADVIYECPVEKRYNRLMGIIEDWRDLEKIGSIRSSRDYFVSYAMEFDPIYVHFGQATPYVADLLNSDEVDNISGAVRGIERPATNAFFRSSDRKAPHNVYASAKGIMKDIEKFGYSLDYDEEYYGKFKFAKDGEDLDYSRYPDAKELYPGGKEKGKKNGFSIAQSHFSYNEADGKYYHFQYGDKHIDDMNGEQLAVDNVIFQYVWGMPRDSEDYLAFECFGSDKSNKCIVFTKGKMIEGTWWRDGANSEPAKYLDENGERILLNQGKTWICTIWTDYEDDVVIE